MNQSDYILWMVAMLGDLVAGKMGLIKKPKRIDKLQMIRQRITK